MVFNEAARAAKPTDIGVTRQRLTVERAKSASVLLERITLAPGGTMQFNVSPKSLAWMQVLDGSATFHAYYTDRMTDVNSAFLPPGFNATLTTSKGAALLHAEVPDFMQVHPGSKIECPLFIVTDWTREAVLASEHDARKRVPLVTPEMCDTTAIKVEMVIFPPGSRAPECHHEGADTFMYVVAGHGTAMANGPPYPVKPGDLIYCPDRERHALKAADDGEMRFVEFHVPAEFQTVWADPSNISAWLATHRDIHGFETAIDEKTRKTFRFVFPWVV